MSAEQLITQHINTWTSALQTRSTAGRGNNGKIDLYGIKKLREMILELAVRGKLVPQDPNDEPASELLKRIAAEKAELVKQGKIKKQKPLPEISEDEKPFKLPQGWVWTSLLELSEINPKIEITDDEQEVSFVPMPCISTRFDGVHEQETRKWIEVKKGYTHFANGDIALAKITPCFENSKAVIFSGLKNGVGVGTTELHVARPCSSELNLQYLLLNIKSPNFLDIGESKMTGSAGQKRVPRSFFENYPLPFPPIEEQIRIVERFCQLMTICDQLEQQSLTSLETHFQLVETLLATLTNSKNAEELAENWARISQHFDTLFTTEASIDALKQTILQLAVMGKLVPQDPNDEPASELLKRIEQEKAQLVKEGKIKKQKPLPPINEDEKPFELPAGWLWCKFGILSDFINGDRGGSYPNKNEYVEHGIPWINTGHIEKNGTLSTVKMNFITQKKYDELRSGKICEGDLVYCLRGATFGKTSFVTPYNQGAIASSLMIIRPHLIELGSYIYNYLISPLGKSQIFRFDNGSAQPNLSANSVMLYAFPCPPLKEQLRISYQIKMLSELCEILKSRLRSARQTQIHLADALTDAALS
ncbi:restriction endonuclease subunit S [Pantoea stewartii]|uniref:restriction endonuclease subunit S n=1 Tax=Pantoea stewartii TaxID=66269 RepID=UPI00197FAA72|nr:restriction endonuclease subunit S [Pantoea stewartii]